MIGHIWEQVARDENEDRVRVLDRCACGAARNGCFAKRADDEGRLAWGTVGVWTVSAPSLQRCSS